VNARAAKAFVFVLLTWVSGLTGASGAGLTELAPWLVRLTGGLKGVYTPVEGRPLAWSLAWSPAEGTQRRGEVLVTGPDLALRVALNFDAAENQLSWRVVEGRVDLAAWLPALATRPELAEMLKGMAATGALLIAGEGAVKDDVITGAMSVSWDDGTLGNAEQGWTLEGVTIRAGGDVSELTKGTVPMEVYVRTISTGRFGARALKVRAALADFALAEIASVDVEIAGGRVTTKPFVVALSEPKLGVDISMEKVGLQDIAALVPDILADGRGRVNGAVRINWSKAAGVSLGTGNIIIDPSERAELRFRPNPGLLTGSLPPAILKYYPGLTNVEMGQASLLAERFEVRISPDGDDDGRTATVNIEGGPVDKTLKAPLVLSINVRGPLAPLIKFGSTPGLKIGGGK
jgi:hypothetical protein